MSKLTVTRVYDWMGPEGPWPNDLSLAAYVSPHSYEKSDYAIGNSRVSYDLETYRVPYTYPKLDPVLLRRGVGWKNKLLTDDVRGNLVYEITPLLKPHQWADKLFDNMSDRAKQLQRDGKLLVVINDMNEGYDPTELFDMLHWRLIRYGLSPTGLVYLSLNAVIGDAYDRWCAKNRPHERIKVQSVHIFETGHNSFMHDVIGEALPARKKRFIALVRQPTPHRVALVYGLFLRGLLKYGHVSMPKLGDEHKAMIEPFGLDTSVWDNFVSMLPLTVDDRNTSTQDCTNTAASFYADADYAVVMEQNLHENQCVKLTEKTFTAIANGALPIFLYAKGSAHELSKLGYVLPHSGKYDLVENDIDRFNAVLDTITHVCDGENQIGLNVIRRENAKQLHIRSRDQHDGVFDAYFGDG